MIINAANLKTFFTGVSTAFNEGFSGAKTAYKDVAMVVKSDTEQNDYGWMGQIPSVREWIGERIINNLAAFSYSIKNRKFENTISVPREKIEDDTFGVFAPLFREMGKAAAEHPDQLVFSLLSLGFTTLCFDKQNFFDTDHPVEQADGSTASVSNTQGGAGEAWYLLDTSRALKAFVFQERLPFKLTSLDKEGDRNVFFQDEYVYGVRGRSNAGYGLWQLAFASKAELNAANYEAARVAMASLKGETGKALGIKATHMVVPPTLEGPAKRLLNNGTRVETVSGTPVPVQNEWAGTAELIVTAHLG
jgi:phage major head subunit gpT-like protein